MDECLLGTHEDAGPQRLCEERAWFAVRVKPQHERTVSYTLQKRGLDCYVPLYRTTRRWADNWKELDLPLFPGYLFCRMRADQSSEVAGLPAVYQLVGQGKSPSAIEERELQVIQRIEKAGLPIGPWPLIKGGQQVRIASGPLTGLVGLLACTPKSWHVVVNVQLLQRGVAVTVDQRQITALASAARA